MVAGDYGNNRAVTTDGHNKNNIPNRYYGNTLDIIQQQVDLNTASDCNANK